MDKKNANILFRADGNGEIGLGHVYRCIAVAERLKESFNCFFIIKQPSSELVAIIEKVATVIVLDGFKNDIEEAIYIATTIIPLHEIHIVTLDGYRFNTAYQKIFKERCDSVLVSIDDDQAFHYVSDIVINHAGGVNSSMFSTETYTRLFLGYNYLLLRKEFIKSLQQKKDISDVHSVLICFGGADPDDLTGKVLNCLKDNQSIQKITIIIGASYTQLENLLRITGGYKHINIQSNLDAKSMADIMFETDLAIVPASTVGLEAFVSKMVLITGMTASNQINIYNGLIKEDSVIGIGSFNLLSCESIQKAVNEATNKPRGLLSMSKNQINNTLPELYKSFV